MSCEECLKLVEAYFDAELDDRENARMAQHLETCAICAKAFRKLESEQELYLRYECDAQPAPAFWDNVMAQATREGATQHARPLSNLRERLKGLLGSFTTPRFSPSLTALIVLVAIGVTALMMSRVNRREKASETLNVPQSADNRAATPSPEMRAGSPSPVEERATKESNGGAGGQEQAIPFKGGMKNNAVMIAGREDGRRSNRRLLVSDYKRTPDDLVREAEQKYVAAIAMLSRDVSRRRSRLDAATVARFERTLAAIDRTIIDTRRAAREHPGDAVAAQYMLTAYAKKVDVLREMVGY